MRLSRLLCGIVLLTLASAGAEAMADDTAALRGELTAIYQKLLADPANVALNQRMVEIALALEDYDAAIGAVERLIFYAPNDPALQLQAAELYLKIKSYAPRRYSPRPSAASAARPGAASGRSASATRPTPISARSSSASTSRSPSRSRSPTGTPSPSARSPSIRP
ncbi:MAG: hypothetical protein J0H08_07890 [Rhizobiales bacterium]|nr:hypothetical protein [Hyphomicrobiales bacterium]